MSILVREYTGDPTDRGIDNMDDSLSAIAKAIDKHIDGRANKQLVFNVFHRDRQPGNETTYRVQNAILSALLALDTAEDVLSFRRGSALASGRDERLRAMRKRRQREEEEMIMKRQRDRQDDGHRQRSGFSGRYGGYQSARYPSSSVARSYFGYRRPVSDFVFDRELDGDQVGLGDRPARKRKLSRRMIEAYEDTNGAGSKRNDTRDEMNGGSASRRLHYNDEDDDETYQPVNATKRTNSGDFTCNWCSDHSKSFGTASALFMHIKYKHPKVRLPLYQCKLCPASFNFQFCIERHVQMKHAQVEIVSSAYRVTPGNDGSDSVSGAGNGGKSTLNRRGSWSKSKEQQDDPDYQEEESGDKKTEAEVAKLKSSGGKCPKCDKSFHSIKYLEEHMAVMHSLRPPKYQCPVCSKAFTWVSNMRQHLRTMHQGAKRKRGTPNGTPEKKITKDADDSPTAAGGHDASGAVTPDLSDQYYSDDLMSFDLQQNRLFKQSLVDEDDPSFDDKTERGGYACKLCGKVFGTLSGRWRHMHNKHNAPKMRPVTKDGKVFYTIVPADMRKGGLMQGKMLKMKKMRKRADKDGEKKDKQIISDRFNYKCSLCGHKFPYPISLFNHMKHIHNSTSAGIVGTPKDGALALANKKRQLNVVDGEMPPPLPQGSMSSIGSSSSAAQNGETRKGDIEEGQAGEKVAEEAKGTPETDSVSGSEQNIDDTTGDIPSPTEDKEEQDEADDKGDITESVNVRFAGQLPHSELAIEENSLEKEDEEGYADMATESDNIEFEEFPSSGSSSSNTLATDETESSDSDDADPNMSQLMCHDEEMHSDFDGPLMIDEASTQMARVLGEHGGIEEDLDDDPFGGDRHNKNLSGRRPMGTGDKTCSVCGKSYHWSAGLWRHQKTTGHVGTL